MTKFQALFILWLRHESFYNCSWRALAWHYYNRYTYNGKVKAYKYRDTKKRYFTPGGNQLEGIFLEEEAFKILVPDSLIGEPIDLFECSLTRIKANLKRHME